MHEGLPTTCGVTVPTLSQGPLLHLYLPWSPFLKIKTVSGHLWAQTTQPQRCLHS